MKTVAEFIDSLPPVEQAFIAYMEQAMAEQDHKFLKAYILLDGEVVETNMTIATMWQSRNPDGVRVDLDYIGDVEVSTVFLTIPHGSKLKRHFETMIFAPDKNYVAATYATFDQAKKGHAELVKRVKAYGLSYGP